MSKAKRKIHKFDFEGNGAHVAIVDKAANLQEVLTMKASEEEITVTLPVREFLSRFFYIWDEDVDLLLDVMGFSTKTTDESEMQILADNFLNTSLDDVGILKGLDIPEKLPKSIYTKIEELEKQFGDKIKTSEGSPLEDNIDIEKGESLVDETKIKVTELETLKADAGKVDGLVKEIEALKSKAAQSDELKTLVADLKKEKEDKAKADMTEVVKGYSFVSDEDKEDLVAFILKAEDQGIILNVLEKARDAIANSAGIEDEAGNEGDGDLELDSIEKSADLTSEILKKRNS